MPDPTPDPISRRETVADRPAPAPLPEPQPTVGPRVTRHVVAWTLTLGALRVGLRRSEWRERWEGRAA